MGRYREELNHYEHTIDAAKKAAAALPTLYKHRDELVAPTEPRFDSREFVSFDNKHRTNGRIVDCDDDAATILKDTGQTVVVPLKFLRAEYRIYAWHCRDELRDHRELDAKYQAEHASLIKAITASRAVLSKLNTLSRPVKPIRSESDVRFMQIVNNELAKAKHDREVQASLAREREAEAIRRSRYYNGHILHTGPRGGVYYINSNGNKTYVSS